MTRTEMERALFRAERKVIELKRAIKNPQPGVDVDALASARDGFMVLCRTYRATLKATPTRPARVS